MLTRTSTTPPRPVAAASEDAAAASSAASAPALPATALKGRVDGSGSVSPLRRSSPHPGGVHEAVGSEQDRADLSHTAAGPGPIPSRATLRIDRLPPEVQDNIIARLPHGDVLNLRQASRALHAAVRDSRHSQALTQAWSAQVQDSESASALCAQLERTAVSLKAKASKHPWRDPPDNPGEAVGVGLSGLSCFPGRAHVVETQETHALLGWMSRLTDLGMDVDQQGRMLWDATVPLHVESKAGVVLTTTLWDEIVKPVDAQADGDQRTVLTVGLIRAVMRVDLQERSFPGGVSEVSRLRALIDAHPDGEARDWLRAFSEVCLLGQGDPFSHAMADWVDMAKSRPCDDGGALALLNAVGSDLLKSQEGSAFLGRHGTPLLDALSELATHAGPDTARRHIDPSLWLQLIARSPREDRMRHLSRIREAFRRTGFPGCMPKLVHHTAKTIAGLGSADARCHAIDETLALAGSIEDPIERHEAWKVCVDARLAYFATDPLDVPNARVAQAIFDGYLASETAAGGDSAVPLFTPLLELATWHSPDARSAAMGRLFDRAPSEVFSKAGRVIRNLPESAQPTVLTWVQKRVRSAPLDVDAIAALLAATNALVAEQMGRRIEAAALASKSFELLLDRSAGLTEDSARAALVKAKSLQLWGRLWADPDGDEGRAKAALAGSASRLFNKAMAQLPADDAECAVWAEACFQIARYAPPSDRGALMSVPWMRMRSTRPEDLSRFLTALESTPGSPLKLAALEKVLRQIPYPGAHHAGMSTSETEDESVDEGCFDLFRRTVGQAGWEDAEDHQAVLAFVASALHGVSSWPVTMEAKLLPLVERLQGVLCGLCRSQDAAVRTSAQALRVRFGLPLLAPAA